VTWIEVEPIWSLLERAGVRTASYYWVGSEGAWPRGRAPSEWMPFSSRTSERDKVDRILAWLDRPVTERPRLITSWFHGADHTAHEEGPGTPEVARALAQQDVEIGRLIDGIDASDGADETTLIIVSDHGMTTAGRRVDLATELRAQDDIRAKVFGIGGFATVVVSDRDRADPDAIARVVARARALGLEAAPRATAPGDWHVDNPRFGDVVVRAPIGTAIVRRGLVLAGFHGYDPSSTEMSALFIASGRGVGDGERVASVRSIDVAPTVLTLLGQPVPEWMEGRPIASIAPPEPASATLGSGPVPSTPAPTDPPAGGGRP